MIVKKLRISKHRVISGTIIGRAYAGETGAAPRPGLILHDLEMPRMDIPGCGRAQGLTMDTQTRRVFMACDTEVVVVNADDGSVVSRVRVPSRADMNCFDPTTQLVFNPKRADSTLSVIHEDSPSKFMVVENVPEGGAARTY